MLYELPDGEGATRQPLNKRRQIGELTVHDILDGWLHITQTRPGGQHDLG